MDFDELDFIFFGGVEWVYSGIEGGIQGANREIQVASST